MNTVRGYGRRFFMQPDLGLLPTQSCESFSVEAWVRWCWQPKFQMVGWLSTDFIAITFETKFNTRWELWIVALTLSDVENLLQEAQLNDCQGSVTQCLHQTRG